MSRTDTNQGDGKDEERMTKWDDMSETRCTNAGLNQPEKCRSTKVGKRKGLLRKKPTRRQ